MILVWLVVMAIVALGATEYAGIHVPGFQTISAAARQDWRVAVLVEVAFVVAAIWWPFHVADRA